MWKYLYTFVFIHLCQICSTNLKKCDSQRGLKTHRRVHSAQPISSVQQFAAPNADIESLDEASIINKFGEIMYKCKCSIPMVRIIQKSVRSIICQELTKVVDYVSAENDVFAWIRLMSFPLIVLNIIPTSDHKNHHGQNIIRHNLSVFTKLNDLPSLFGELLKLLSTDLPKKPRSHSEKLVIKIAQRKVGEGDISGAVRVLSSQEGIADFTPETVKKLKQKHPDERPVLDDDPLPDQQFETTDEEILNSIKHFPISSSGGIDWLRPRHLKDRVSQAGEPHSIGKDLPKYLSCFLRCGVDCVSEAKRWHKTYCNRISLENASWQNCLL